jgi:hypothetical protein
MHSLLETYLSELAAHLSALPTKPRVEELREIRAHLENAVAGYQAQGRTEEASARAALAQFGTPQAVGSETILAWRRGERLYRRSFWGAAACTLAVRFLMPFLLAPLETVYLHPTSPGHFVGPSVWVLCGFNIAGPILAGAVSGLFFPKRAVAGAGLGLVAYFSLALAIRGYWFAHHGMATYPVSFQTILLSLTGQFVTGGSVSLLSAWAVSRWHMARLGTVRMARG